MNCILLFNQPILKSKNLWRVEKIEWIFLKHLDALKPWLLKYNLLHVHIITRELIITNKTCSDIYESHCWSYLRENSTYVDGSPLWDMQSVYHMRAYPVLLLSANIAELDESKFGNLLEELSHVYKLTHEQTIQNLLSSKTIW